MQGLLSATKKRGRAADPLTRVAYRSRAVRPMPGPALLGLARAAPARNAHEAVTGLVLCDRARRASFNGREGRSGAWTA